MLLLLLVMALLPLCAASAEESDYELGVAAYAARQYKKAAQHLLKYLEQSPDARAYYFLGYAIYALEREGSKEFGESAEYFRQAYLIDPDFDPMSVRLDVKRPRLK
jgi:tetratricopeptide (TPR) repeat protein